MRKGGTGVSGEQPRVDPVDIVVAVSGAVLDVAGGVTRRGSAVLGPVGALVLRPVLRPRWLPARLQPGRGLEALGRHGRTRRAALLGELSRRLDALVPGVLDEVLTRVDLTDVVLGNVDLDRVVSDVDLDAAAARLDVSAVLDRIDLDDVVRRVDVAAVVERVDVEPVVARVDLDAAARRLDLDAVLARLDLTAIVLERVDLDAVLAAVLDRIDLDDVVRRVDVAAVVERVDVEPVVARVDLDAVAQRLDLDAVLARLDLTRIVLERVDLDAVLAAVLARLDLVALAAEVIDGVDLPEIIRESTGSMASDTVQGVRMQAIGADEAVGRAVDRFLLRRSARSTKAPPAVPAPRDRRG
jgi:hypothetical protein